MHTPFRAISVLLVCLAMTTVACASPLFPQPIAQSSTDEFTQVSVQLSWTHGAQFAGMYTAVEQGEYAAEGLEVTFLEGGPAVDRLAPVLEGSAQFGIASGTELLQARAEGKPLRAIATIFARSPFAFFALADSGITKPADFVGKTILVRTRARPILLGMMARVDVAPDQYTEDATANFTDLYAGTIDVASGFVTTELLAAKQDGYRLNIIYPDDHGVHFTTDSIFTTDEYIAANPELVTGFLRATLQGWTYALDHPDTIGPLIAKYNPAADIDYEVDVMAASLPLIRTGINPIGWMSSEEWSGMAETLQQYGGMSQTVEIGKVYTLQFLQAIYGDTPWPQ